MRIKRENIRVTVKQGEPEPIWIDFDDAHFRIYGPLAWIYNALKVTKSEDEAQAMLRPQLMAAKMKSGAISPENAAQTL